MPNFYLPAQIEQLKRRARILADAHAITHSAALDRVATEEGFANWSLLMKHSGPFLDALAAQPPYRFRRTEEEWKAALRMRHGGQSRAPQYYTDLINICSRFVAPYNAGLFALDYMQSLLARRRFRVPTGSLAYMEVRWWLPYAVHDVTDDSAERLILNRHYKPVGFTANEWVKYEDFSHLHVRLDFSQLKRFGIDGPVRGHLFDDGSAPWFSRDDAVAYEKRLRSLIEVLVEAQGRSTSPSSWTYTQNAVHEALSPWASVPTWHTPHPSDEMRFNRAIEELRRTVGSRVTDEDVRIALRQHREDNLELLGAKASDARLEEYVQRIMGVLGSA
jgi:hypothetical protein